MSTSIQDSNPETPSVPPPAVPNFREDERIQTRYASMLERRKKTFAVEHEASVRRNASTKRDELRDELDEANAEWERRKDAAEVAREAYRKAYPHHVKKTRLLEPSVIENVRSLGAANKLYHAAEEAWRAAESASSNIRRIEHNENQLEIELKKALERAPEIAKDVTESEKWLAEIHAEEELGGVKAKVDEFAVEREGYANRLSAGKVSPDELRLRAFAQGDVKHIALPVSGLIFYRIDEFGPSAYVVVRDLRKQLYALPYDPRLEKLFGGVYDISRAGKEFQVQPSMRDGGRAPLSVMDHFTKCSENTEAAQEAYAQHQAFVAQPRALPATSEADELEGTAVRLLAEFAEAKTT
jgi:hypothetical protein